MAQAGLHSIVGVIARKWTPDKTWLMLGIVLGNPLPDADNFMVAVATVAKLPTEGLHRTFTHSLFTVLAIVLVFQIVSWITKREAWRNLGLGLGIGILMHIFFDLVVWFNGVEIFWPLSSWVNLWERVTPPDWWMTLMNPAEFLAFAMFFVLLERTARKRYTDMDYISRLRLWTWVQIGLFVVFTPLAFMMDKGFLTIYGALYLISLVITFNVIIRMRNTIEAIA